MRDVSVGLWLTLGLALWGCDATDEGSSGGDAAAGGAPWGWPTQAALVAWAAQAASEVLAAICQT